jgi:hypothetical protein
MAQTSVKAIPRVDYNANLLAPGYLPMNPLGLDEACFAVRVINDSNTDIDISFDGAITNEWIHAGGELYLYAQMNNQPRANEALVSKGTKIYVSAAGAGIGTIMLVGYYV